MTKKAKVCIFSGHTGGHLFPSQAFAERFKKRFPSTRIILVTSPKARPILASLHTSFFDEVFFLNEFPFFTGFTLRTLRFMLEFCRGFLISYRFLSRVQPDLCVGFGSYVSYPGMRIAAWKKIPTLIHEQNSVAGKATAMLAPSVGTVAVSFSETRFKTRPGRLAHTGLPVREALYEASKRFERSFREATPENPLKILVTGGSQGAREINRAIFESFAHLSPEERKKIAVTHITGVKNFDPIAQQYSTMNIKSNIFPFYENMQELYQQSDFAITRAGANTLFELALFKVPAVVIPFRHAAENHQELNAREFESRQALRLMREEEMTGEKMADQIRDFMDPETRRGYASRIGTISSADAGELLVDAACALLKEKN